MKTIEIIYLTAAAISMGSSIPQITQLIKTKKSDELSLFTWFTWTLGQIISSIYALQVRAYAYLIMSSVWVVFYALMVFLIWKYRSTKVTFINRQHLSPKVCVVKFGPNFIPLNRI